MECLDSRRLTGPSLIMDGAGAVIDARFGDGPENGPDNGDGEAFIAEWQRQVKTMLAAVGWEGEQSHVYCHSDGVSLAISAPIDALYAATDINDWAWQAACAVVNEAEPPGPDQAASGLDQAVAGLDQAAAGLDQAAAGLDQAAAGFRDSIAHEQNPALRELYAQAQRRRLPCLVDDDFLSIGLGRGSQSWPVDGLPSLAEVDWPSLHTIPVALVTGTNGKTTSVRMAAAMARAAGRVVGICSTDWIAVDDAIIDSGDYS